MTVYDKLMADTVGVSVQEWLERTSELDSDQLDSITSRLVSDEDSVINEGIRMFNDI